MITCLRHIITTEGVETDPEKIKAIIDFPAPNTVKELRRFLGMPSWHRRLINDFSKIVAPLINSLKKNKKITFGEQQLEAFKTLKQKVTEAPLLACQPFILQTDASDKGLGAALVQKIGNNEKVIAYASCTLNGPELNYSVTEKECLAIIWGIQKHRAYLEGCAFTVITDHYSLKWIRTIKSPAGRLARWAMYLQQYDFDVVYRKGSLNSVADALLRTPVPSLGNLLMPKDIESSWYKKKQEEVRRYPKIHPNFMIINNRLHRHFWSSYRHGS